MHLDGYDFLPRLTGQSEESPRPYYIYSTDAGQISRNLLLVPKATVNVKPNLQIVADDVVCTHGCTVSDLEEEELFYIQSRGLSPTTARSLLVAGFGLEIVSKLEHEDLRTRVSGVVRNALDEDDVVLAV